MICEACFTSPGRGPFTDCRRAKGYFDGACGNCKWRDHAARCSVRQPGQGSGDEDSEDSEEDEAEEGGAGGRTIEDAIMISDDDDNDNEEEEEEDEGRMIEGPVEISSDEE